MDSFAHTARIEIQTLYVFLVMNEDLKQLGKDLVDVFRKHGIEISEGSLELKTKPFYRKGNGCIIQPMEITFDRLLAYQKRRIDGTYDDIWVQ